MKKFDEMKYAFNVYETLVSESSVSSGDKTRFFFMLGILGMICVAGIALWLSVAVFHIDPIYIIIVVIIMFIVVAFWLWSVFIFKIGEKRAEFEGYGGDGFNKFCGVKIDEEISVDTKEYIEVPAYDYLNGTKFVGISFKNGSNDSRKCMNTLNAYEKLYNLLSTSDFEFHTVVLNENYLESKECKNIKRNLASIEDEYYSSLMTSVANVYLQIAEHKSFIDEEFIVIKTSRVSQVYGLEILLTEFIREISKMSSQVTAFRDISFLGETELENLIKDYYGVKAIDMSMIGALSVNIDDRVTLEGIVVSEVLLSNGVKLTPVKEAEEKEMSTRTKVV